MANKEFHGINDFYFVKGKDEPETTPEDVEAIDESPAKDEPELKISTGVFLPGPDGFDFLKECSVKVNVGFLKEEKKSAKIDFSLFSLYTKDGKELEYDHKYQVNANASREQSSDSGYAEAKIPKLWYDENYYDDTEKSADATCAYFFLANHPRALEKNVKSELLEMPQAEEEPELDGEIFLNTKTDELGIVSPDDMEIITREIKISDAFLPYMKVFIPKEGANEKDSAAEAYAVMYWHKKVCDETDNNKIDEFLNTLDTKIAEEKDNYLKEQEQKGAVSAKGHKMQAGDIQEYWWVTGKRMIRVRNKNVPKRYRWFDRKTVGEKIRKELEDDKEGKKDSKGPKKEAEIKIFEKKLFPPGESEPEWLKEFNESFKKDFWEENKILDGGIGAQFLRYSYEGSVDSSIKWGDDEKSIKVGAKVEGSFALANAQGHFTINLPDENGFDLIEHIRSDNPSLVDADSGNAFLKFQIAVTGSAFVGVCASVSANLGVVLDPKSPEAGKPSDSEESVSAGLEAGLDLFAGGKVGADVKLSFLMKLIDDKEISFRAVDWASLGDASFGTWAAVGAGIVASFKVGYFNGRFRYHTKLGAVLEYGAGASIKGSIGVENGAKFIWTVVTAFNWKHISKVFDQEVHDFFQGLMLNCFYTGKAVAEIYEEIQTNAEDALFAVSKVVEQGLAKGKAFDDMLDDFVPGYSGFKQYNAQFLILKSTYNFLKQVNQNYDLKTRAIHVVEAAVKDKLNDRWKYATWQMKVNLIYDMRIGGSGIGGFTEERKEDAIIAVLESARNDGEFGKIVKKLEKPENRESVDINQLLDFKQQARFNELKKEHNFIN